MSRTSGFVDDVISAQKPRLLDVAAQLRRSSHAALGLAINGAYEYPLQATDARDYFAQSDWVAATGAETALLRTALAMKTVNSRVVRPSVRLFPLLLFEPPDR